MVYQIKMKNGEFWSPKAIELPKSLRIARGKAWVTISGIKEDFILGEGEVLPHMGPGVLIESLSEELIVEGDL